jgi:hypothetical protein
MSIGRPMKRSGSKHASDQALRAPRQTFNQMSALAAGLPVATVTDQRLKEPAAHTRKERKPRAFSGACSCFEGQLPRGQAIVRRSSRLLPPVCQHSGCAMRISPAPGGVSKNSSRRSKLAARVGERSSWSHSSVLQRFRTFIRARWWRPTTWLREGRPFETTTSELLLLMPGRADIMIEATGVWKPISVMPPGSSTVPSRDWLEVRAR